MNKYVYKLVTQDLGFGQQIEDALKKIQIQKEMEAAEDELEDIDEHVQLEDQDYEDFYEDVNNQKERDMKVLLGEED